MEMYDRTVAGSMRWVPSTTICWIILGLGAAGVAAAADGAPAIGAPGFFASTDEPASAKIATVAIGARATLANRVMWLIQSSRALVSGLDCRSAAFRRRFRKDLALPGHSRSQG